MKLNLKYIAGLGLLIISISSCHREYLNPTPQNTISDASAFSTNARIMTQVNGLYLSLKNGPFTPVKRKGNPNLLPLPSE